jgi:hypothetical protein
MESASKLSPDDMRSKCTYVQCLTAMDGLRFKEHIAAGHCNGQQTKLIPHG